MHAKQGVDSWLCAQVGNSNRITLLRETFPCFFKDACDVSDGPSERCSWQLIGYFYVSKRRHEEKKQTIFSSIFQRRPGKKTGRFCRTRHKGLSSFAPKECHERSMSHTHLEALKASKETQRKVSVGKSAGWNFHPPRLDHFHPQATHNQRQQTSAETPTSSRTKRTKGH